MIEGPGHVPMDQIEMNVREAAGVVPRGAVLRARARWSPTSPPATTTSPPPSAPPWPAGTAPRMLCYVTPKEHLGLPNKDDVQAGRHRLQDRRPRRRHRPRPPRRPRPRRRALQGPLRLRLEAPVRALARPGDRPPHARRDAAATTSSSTPSSAPCAAPSSAPCRSPATWARSARSASTRIELESFTDKPKMRQRLSESRSRSPPCPGRRPSYLDREATIDKACELIAEAGR